MMVMSSGKRKCHGRHYTQHHMKWYFIISLFLILMLKFQIIAIQHMSSNCIVWSLAAYNAGKKKPVDDQGKNTQQIFMKFLL